MVHTAHVLSYYSSCSRKVQTVSQWHWNQVERGGRCWLAAEKQTNEYFGTAGAPFAPAHAALTLWMANQPCREIGSSCLGMAQMPLEGEETQRSERDPSLQGEPALAGLESDRCILGYPLVITQLGSSSFLGQQLGSCTGRGKVESTPVCPLSHVYITGC